MNAYPYLTAKRPANWLNLPRHQQDEVLAEKANCLAEFEPTTGGFWSVIGACVFIYLGILCIGFYVFVDILVLPIVMIAGWWWAVEKRMFVVRVMRDGLIVSKAQFLPAKPFIEFDTRSYDWNDIEIIDFRPNTPNMKITTRGEAWPILDIKPQYVPYAEMQESLYIKQQRGIIPQSVVLFQRPPAAARKSFGARLRDGLFWVAVLFGIFIIPPLYAGGGRTFNAIAPTLVEIIPDAVKQAIDAHPDWPLGTVVKLRAIALGATVTPTALLPLFEPPGSPTLAHAAYACLYWVLKIESRDQQVDMMAGYLGGLVDGNLQKVRK